MSVIRAISRATALFATASPQLVLADTGGYGHMGDWFPGMGGHWMFGLFWMLLLVLIVVLLLRWVGGVSGGKPDAPSALDILKQRYARGEIDGEEFQRRRRDLEG